MSMNSIEELGNVLFERFDLKGLRFMGVEQR